MSEAAKNDGGKLQYGLIPTEPLRELARVYTIGAAKPQYGPENWRKGMKYSRVYSALQRHANAWWEGETHDPEDKQHHLSSVAWCAFTLMWYEIFRPQCDDRYIDGFEAEATWHPTVVESREELAETAFRMAAEVKHVPAIPRPDILERLAACRLRSGVALPKDFEMPVLVVDERESHNFFYPTPIKTYGNLSATSVGGQITYTDDLGVVFQQRLDIHG